MSIIDQFVAPSQGVSDATNIKNDAEQAEKLEYLVANLDAIKTKITDMSVIKAEIESQIVELVGVPKGAGTEVKEGTINRVAVRQSATRKVVDARELQKIAPEVVKTEYKVDTRKLNSLAQGAPERYQQALRYIETKYNKPTLTITELNKAG